MSQDGEHLIAMQANAAQYPGAVASVVSDAEYATLLQTQLLDSTVAISKVKAEAQRRIYARYPQWKQANLHGRTTKLLAIESGRYRDADGTLQPARALTAAEIQEVAAGGAAMAWIESVRAASDLVESDFAAAGYAASFNIAGSARWPA